MLSNLGQLNSAGLFEKTEPAVSAGTVPATEVYPSRLPSNPWDLRQPPGARLVDLGQMPLSKPQTLGGDLQKLVVGEEIQGLLQAQPGSRGQPHRDVRGRGPDVRLLLLAAHVDPDVSWPL